MDLICDTNVWYDIAAGYRNPQTLTAPGHRLLATPVSFVEITSGLTEASFEKRSGAARAVVTFASEVVEDTDRHLATLWGLSVLPLDIDWFSAFKAIGMASNLLELRTGVPDYEQGVTRIVRPEVASKLREHWDSFADDIELLVDRFFPGYAAARKRKKHKRARKDLAQLFAAVSRLPEIERLTAVATRQHAALNLVGPPGDSSEEELDCVAAKLLPYIRAYARYVLNCATTYAPKTNDWGDLECFIYLQDNRRLLTRDNRWLDIAKEADLLGWVLDPEAT